MVYCFCYNSLDLWPFLDLCLRMCALVVEYLQDKLFVFLHSYRLVIMMQEFVIFTTMFNSGFNPPIKQLIALSQDKLTLVRFFTYLVHFYKSHLFDLLNLLQRVIKIGPQPFNHNYHIFIPTRWLKILFIPHKGQMPFCGFPSSCDATIAMFSLTTTLYIKQNCSIWTNQDLRSSFPNLRKSISTILRNQNCEY